MGNIYNGLQEWLYGEVSVEEFLEREEVKITLMEMLNGESIELKEQAMSLLSIHKYD